MYLVSCYVRVRFCYVLVVVKVVIVVVDGISKVALFATRAVSLSVVVADALIAAAVAIHDSTPATPATRFVNIVREQFLVSSFRTTPAPHGFILISPVVRLPAQAA